MYSVIHYSLHNPARRAAISAATVVDNPSPSNTTAHGSPNWAAQVVASTWPRYIAASLIRRHIL